MGNDPHFTDRLDAGRQLAARLRPYRGEHPLVIGLPRGGVPVAYEVALELDAPLDVCVVRKLGAPLQPELAIGAVAEAGAVHIEASNLEATRVSDEQLVELVARKRAEVEERVLRYRAGAPPLEVRDRTVVVVDDGLATGSTARAAIHALRGRGAGRIVLAVPVAAADSLRELEGVADEIVCLHPEEDFYAVGLWYESFATTTDEEVVALLERARARAPRPARRTSERVRLARERDVRIPFASDLPLPTFLEGHLVVPERAAGVVVFAHGSGSSRHSPRNRLVAGQLQREGFATLLLDLLTVPEEQAEAAGGTRRFDIELLATRLVTATDWVTQDQELAGLPIGYFGASTGAAAALVAAVARANVVRAIVSRGGRPDLAATSLPRVEAPTLLLVGGADTEVLQLNRLALSRLACERKLEVVPHATHLFEEPGALEHVAASAARWFHDHLRLSEVLERIS